MINDTRFVAPVWPLQSTVAVNPFWNQIDRPFDEVMSTMSSLLHESMYMPLSYFIELYSKGEISDQDIAFAARRFYPTNGATKFVLKDFVRQTAEAQLDLCAMQSFADFADRKAGSSWQQFVRIEIAKYASAFFDESQALAKYPWRDQSFYSGWFAAQEFDDSFQKSGLGQFRELISEFRLLAPSEALALILSRLGFSDESEAALYVGRLSVLNIGWASQFCYHDFQRGLGASTELKIQLSDLVCVQLIIDYAIAQHFEVLSPGLTKLWLESFRANKAMANSTANQFDLHKIWQTALERSRRNVLANQIKPRAESAKLPAVQIAMCIDVRSESYRRAIESVSTDVETIGFAGFFGLPLEYKKIDETAPTTRAPVLLTAAFQVEEEFVGTSRNRKLDWALVRSYFRNLRKAPMSSFLFVELFSVVACSKLVMRFIDSLRFSRSRSLPAKFADGVLGPSQEALLGDKRVPMDNGSKIQIAKKVLTHMGLTTRFGRLVVFAGHGSANCNNAFVSAAECGACGGHSGDVNARFLTNLLNDPQIRQGLREASFTIPDSTYFLAAIHETVTDELFLLDTNKVPDSFREELARLQGAIDKAGPIVRRERQVARSECLDRSPWRRTKNWSEVRPEWGLAGNSCFIVAPRRFTKGADLQGRSFLHDYDWRQDRNFETLELIMTAPMVVTNWINFQYYASTVAPKIYGSGSKVLHNLVNETGVVEGNNGDLRIGLPWQSVHDGAKFVHEPVRLAVYLAAPIEQIEAVIRRHPTVRNLVVNEWLHIFQIDEDSGKILQREAHGEYLEIGSTKSS